MKHPQDDPRTTLYNAITDLDDDIIEEAGNAVGESGPSARRSPKVYVMRRFLAVAACLCLALIVGVRLHGSGILFSESVFPDDMAAHPGASTSSSTPSGSDVSTAEGTGPSHAASNYDEVLSFFKDPLGRSSHDKDIASNDNATDNNGTSAGYGIEEMNDKGFSFAGQSSDSAEDSAAQSSTEDSQSAGSVNHSDTNVQVEGIDEGDIMETDGRYIYRLSGNTLVAFSAKGADTEEISRVSFKTVNSKAKKDSDVYWRVQEMFLSGNKLIVVGSGDIAVNEYPSDKQNAIVFKEEASANQDDSEGQKDESYDEDVKGQENEASGESAKVKDEGAEAKDASAESEDGAEKSKSDSAAALGSSADSEIVIDMAKYSRADKSALSSSITIACVLDVSKPEKPTLLYKLAQDGSYRTSRLENETLTLITDMYVETYLDDNVKSTQLDAFVPRVFGSDDAVLYVPAEDIWISKKADKLFTDGYTVVGRYGIEDGSASDVISLIGDVGIVYLSPNALYMTQTRYEETSSSERTVTTLSKFPLSDGQIGPSSSVELNGEPLNQFSMDEYEGYLRIALTDIRYESVSKKKNASKKASSKQDGDTDLEASEEDSASVDDSATDEDSLSVDESAIDVDSSFIEEVAIEDVFSAPFRSVKTNSLYVLDDSLKVVGKIKKLAPKEEIKSVRFDGPIGYVCTFKEIDPLFAIDLANPEKPEVLSALKIPGFSDYMHPFGNGLLLGLGESVSDNMSSGLKLSMFDISNPKDVREITSLELKDSWSEALYDHKAVFVSVEKGLVGFPVDDGYKLFRYTESGKFKPFKLSDGGDALGEVPEDTDSDDVFYYADNGDIRVLYCGTDLYICSNMRLVAYSLENGHLLKAIEYMDAEDFYDDPAWAY